MRQSVTPTPTVRRSFVRYQAGEPVRVQEEVIGEIRFTVFLGEIEESKAFEDFVFTHHGPGRLVAGQLPAAPRGPRLSALEKVAERLTELYRRRAFDRLRRAA